jgi:sigma-B regulation protein RsbU (phosphoserine phosphatase)
VLWHAVTQVGDDVFDLSAVDSQQLLDALGDAVVVADHRSRILYVNASAEHLLGWERTALVGRHLTLLMPDRMRSLHNEGFDRYQRTGDARILNRGPVRLPALRSDGVEIEIELTLSNHELAGGREVFVGSLRDLTDRLALERERALANYLLAMRDIAGRLGSGRRPPSADEAGPLILSAVGETLEWDVGGMWTVDGDVLRPRHTWAAPGFADAAAEMEDPSYVLRPGEGIPGRVLATGEAAWIEDLRRETNYPRQPIATKHGLRSCFAFPIVVQGRVVAVAEFCSAARRDAEPDLLPAMASAGAEIGRLIEREEARRQADQAREHLIGMAEALQASLLPPHPPVIPGVQLAARYRAAAGEGQVGGDFFDVFPLADGGWAVAIGDVSGRGPRAAALTALARYTLRAAAVAASSASDVLRVLNDVVLHELQSSPELREEFLTVAFLTLRTTPDGLALQLSCGGHPPPLVLRDAGELEEVACRGRLVGVFEAWEGVDIDVVLRPGDAMVLYTDGAIEGRGPAGIFGEERLRAVVSAGAGSSAEGLVTLVESAVLEHVADQAHDDMAILVLRLPSTLDEIGVRTSALTASAPAPVASN